MSNNIENINIYQFIVELNQVLNHLSYDSLVKYFKKLKKHKFFCKKILSDLSKSRNVDYIWYFAKINDNKTLFELLNEINFPNKEIIPNKIISIRNTNDKFNIVNKKINILFEQDNYLAIKTFMFNLNEKYLKDISQKINTTVCSLQSIINSEEKNLLSSCWQTMFIIMILKKGSGYVCEVLDMYIEELDEVLNKALTIEFNMIDIDEFDPYSTKSFIDFKLKKHGYAFTKLILNNGYEGEYSYLIWKYLLKNKNLEILDLKTYKITGNTFELEFIDFVTNPTCTVKKVYINSNNKKKLRNKNILVEYVNCKML